MWRLFFVFLVFQHVSVYGDDNIFLVKKVGMISEKVNGSEDFWNKVEATDINLVGQMMVVPRPKKTTTKLLSIKAVHDGENVVFKLRWADKNQTIGEKLGEFSDAVAVQFPVQDNADPPAFFMGEKGKPVHIYHWKSIYQQDELQGRKDIKEIYPHGVADTYPQEFADHGKLGKPDQAKQDMFNHAKAAGNPQAFPKKAVDELIAEGFGSTSTMKDIKASGLGTFKDGAWEVVIKRPLTSEMSKLVPGDFSHLCLAVWQGDEKEIGPRRSITSNWVRFGLEK